MIKCLRTIFDNFDQFFSVRNTRTINQLYICIFKIATNSNVYIWDICKRFSHTIHIDYIIMYIQF